MALVVADRIKETTTTTGTGAISLAGAADNFAAFSSVLSDGDTTYYCIVDDTNLDYEVGLGTYASGTNTLARTTILDSSNAGSAVNLGSGTKDIFVTYPADKAVYVGSNVSDLTNDAGYLTSSSSLNASNINSGTIGDAYLPATISSNITGSSASCTGNAASASTVAITATGSSVFHRMVFTDDNNTTTTTGNLYKDSASNFYYNPSSNTLYATTFAGNLSGNATNATTASNANDVYVALGTSNIAYNLIYDSTSTAGYKNLYKNSAKLYYNPSQEFFAAVANSYFGQSSSNFVRINSSTSTGILEFNNDTCTYRYGSTSAAVRYEFGSGTIRYIMQQYIFRPYNNGDASLGEWNTRWNYIYLINSPIVSSDERNKEQITDLDEAEKRVAVKAKALLKKYKLKKEVAEFGVEAKWHVGIIAQELRDAFISEGLNPLDYNLIGHKEWWENEVYYLPDENYPDGRTEKVTYYSAAEAPEGSVHRDEYSVVYEELLAFIVASL